MRRDTARERLAELVSLACDGEVTPQEAAAAPSLGLLGVGSLAMLRMIDSVESEFGVPLVLDDVTFLDSIDGLMDHLVAQGLVLDAVPG